ncbi:MAG: hypothetical protein Q4C03_04330 [bacterium]|nr:hypothetical protein [bacterium]
MTEEHANTLIVNIERAVGKGDPLTLSEAMADAIKAMVHCQFKQGSRVKEMLNDVKKVSSNFDVCPARINDKVDHKRIAVIETRIEKLETTNLVEATEKKTISKMVRALYAVGGAGGAAAILKALDIIIG